MSDPIAPAPTRAAFIFIFITVALDMLALGVMVPVLPKLIVEFEGGDVARAARLTGVFGFAWAAMQFVFSPVVGAASDRFGRRPIVLMSNLGMGLDYILMALAPSVMWLFVGRLISGVTSASFSTAGAYIADVSPPEKRAARFGMLGAAFGLGFIVGPAVGGVLGGIHLRLPFWVAGGLSLANALYGFFILPESLPRERRTALRWRSANPFGALKLLRSHPALPLLTAVVLMQYLAHEALPSTYVLYASSRFQWTESQVGWALAAIGAGSMLVSALGVGRVVKWLGERAALLTGIAMGAVAFLLFGLVTQSWMFAAAIPVFSLWGLANPTLQSLMSRRVGAEQQGQLQGALSGVRGMTGMVGPLMFTQVFGAALSGLFGGRVPGAAYVLSALLLAAAFVLATRATRPETVTA